MLFSFSKHALEQMNLRSISIEQVSTVLQNPDKIEIESEGQHIFQKTIHLEERNYLIRVFVNVDKAPPLIKTVYKTSKIGKYQ